MFVKILERSSSYDVGRVQALSASSHFGEDGLVAQPSALTRYLPEKYTPSYSFSTTYEVSRGLTMKPEECSQAQQARLSEGMRLIFDQESLSSRSSSLSSSQDSSYSSSKSRHSSYRSRHRRQDRCRSRSSSSSSSSSNSDSSSDSRSRTRSRSHPRCHRASGRSRCRHRRHSPPRRYRARSRSYSPSPDRSFHRGRRHRAYSRSRSRSSRERYSRRSYRSRSRSSSYRGAKDRFVGRYRCRFSPSPRRRTYRHYRSRSRSLERSAVRLSQKEKMDLLNIAKENATKILGVQNLELPASVKIVEQREKKPESNTEERVRAGPVTLKKLAQDKDVTNEDDTVARTSPTRKPITFNINNAVAKPSSSPTFHVTESKVTSRADSVGNRKPYGQWVPVKKSSRNKH